MKVYICIHECTFHCNAYIHFLCLLSLLFYFEVINGLLGYILLLLSSSFHLPHLKSIYIYQCRQWSALHFDTWKIFAIEVLGPGGHVCPHLLVLSPFFGALLLFYLLSQLGHRLPQLLFSLRARLVCRRLAFAESLKHDVVLSWWLSRSNDFSFTQIYIVYVTSTSSRKQSLKYNSSRQITYVLTGRLRDHRWVDGFLVPATAVYLTLRCILTLQTFPSNDPQ